MSNDMALPNRLSYSALSTYAECGEKYRLGRGFGLDKASWFATVAGSAIHEITEKIDLAEIGHFGGAIPTFKAEFDRRLEIEKSKGVEIKPSGKVLKNFSITGGPNKKDYDWWLIYGPQFVENWREWKRESKWQLAVMPDGKPGVEITITQRMGGKNHLGFIDRVYITEHGEIVVVDLKSGAIPSSTLQLGVYGVGLWREYGLLAQWGCYWMASTGKLTEPKDLSWYSEEYIDAQYEMAWAGIEAGVFLPNVSSLCKGCGVREHCRAVGGMESVEIPIRSIPVRHDTNALVANSARSV